MWLQGIDLLGHFAEVFNLPFQPVYWVGNVDLPVLVARTESTGFAGYQVILAIGADNFPREQLVPFIDHPKCPPTLLFSKSIVNGLVA